MGMSLDLYTYGFFVLVRTDSDVARKHPLKYKYIQKVRAVTPIGYSPNGMI